MAKELEGVGVAEVGGASASERRRSRSGDADAGAAPRGRWSAGKKRKAVLRLLRGESLDTVSRELRVPAVRLAGWRDDFLEGGTAKLLARPTSPAEFQLRKAQAKIGELMMRLELHEKKDMMRAVRRRSEG